MRKDTVDHPSQTVGGAPYGNANGSATSAQNPRTRAGSLTSSSNDSPAGARPRSSTGRGGTAQQRLTIVNIGEEELRLQQEEEAERARRQPPTIIESPISIAAPMPLPASGPASKAGSQWPSAEEEKERLFRQAAENVKRFQGRGPADVSVSTSHHDRGSLDLQATPQNGQADTASVKSSTTAGGSSKTQHQWPTAEEEKARLFAQAQAAVARTHGFDPATSPVAGGSSSGAGGSGRALLMSAGAALYSEAMSEINKPAPAPVVASPTPVRQSTSSATPSASDEKAILQRYYEAKNAVWQTQSAHYGRVPGNAEPVPYDALYPNQQQPGSASPSGSQFQPQTPPPPAGMPPAFPVAGGSSTHPILSEKERLRRHYEAQDAAATQQQQQPWQPAPPPADYASSPPPGPYPAGAGGPPPFAAASPSTPLSAYAEKELLRRRYEEQDATASQGARPTPTPPPRSSQTVNGRSSRPQPTPPTSPSAPVPGRPLTAAEEKARLRAMYEAEERRAPPPPLAPTPPMAAVLANGYSPYPSPPPSNGFHAPGGTPPPPPPLAPRPPKEYIEETRVEDARTTAKLSALDAGGARADPDLASVVTGDTVDGEEDLDADSALDVEAADAQDSTFGPGALSSMNLGSVGAGSSSPGPSRSNTLGPSRSNTGASLVVPPPPPLPPKVTIE